MSILISAANTGLRASTNLSNPQSCTKMVWAKLAATPTNFQTILNTRNSGATLFNQLFVDSSGNLNIGTAPGTFTNFSANPTYTGWVCYVMTSTTVGAGSLIAYYQPNAGGGFTSASITGQAFTISTDEIASEQLNQAATMAFYMEWNIVLTPTQLQSQFLSQSPNVALGNLSRYEQMTNAATAGIDSSGNGFNMSVVGSLTDGASLPTFPITQALSPGAFAFTGEPATFAIGGVTNYLHLMAPGSFWVNGAASYSDLQCDSAPGVFSLTGQPATFQYSQSVIQALNAGAFTLAGQSATFVVGGATNPPPATPGLFCGVGSWAVDIGYPR
jgi:hypothetical protein